MSSTSAPIAVACAAAALAAAPALAFPPYRSTDADTADPYALELRVGLFKLERDGGETEVVAPLTRLNFGLPGKFELISELEYAPEEDAFAEGALGAKWVPVFGDAMSFGIETLALMPVRPGDQGAGVEAQLVATRWGERVRTHVNAGGFHDPRGADEENGWRASVLSEFPREGWRPGVELFAKQVDGEDADVRAGLGVIYDFGGLDLRAGAHAGLTDAAPDAALNVWISTKLAFR